jgi:hypothetical protein
MPIKFRCSYCRQFLGISRSQAGGVVHCPSCGRSIRVPELDGTVQPLSDPELNVHDQQLLQALDELARLAESPVQSDVSLTSSVSDKNESETLLPQPLLEPIPIEVPMPPTPVAVQPAVAVALATAAENQVADRDGLFAELAALSATQAAIRTDESLSRPEHADRRSRRFVSSTGIVAVVGFASFMAGMLTERLVRVLESRGHAKTAPQLQPQSPVVNQTFTGRITYKTNLGEIHPDRGARVLVFPEKRVGEIKLSVVGFRPADGSADQRVANAALQGLGGGAATADEKGVFEMSLDAGSYALLILSHFQQREDSSNDPALLKLLSEYFEKPDQLLGQRRYHFSTVRIKGTGDIWDQSF